MGIRYKFILEEDPEKGIFQKSRREIIHVHYDEKNLDELLTLFEEWLRGVGYVFDGVVTIVSEEELYGKPKNEESE